MSGSTTTPLHAEQIREALADVRALELPINHAEAWQLAIHERGTSNVARCYLDLLSMQSESTALSEQKWHDIGKYACVGPYQSLSLEAGERAYINYRPTGRWFIVLPDPGEPQPGVTYTPKAAPEPFTSIYQTLPLPPQPGTIVTTTAGVYPGTMCEGMHRLAMAHSEALKITGIEERSNDKADEQRKTVVWAIACTPLPAQPNTMGTERTPIIGVELAEKILARVESFQSAGTSITNADLDELEECFSAMGVALQNELPSFSREYIEGRRLRMYNLIQRLRLTPQSASRATLPPDDHTNDPEPLG